MLLAAGAKPLLACRQTGTNLTMIEKHYGDARVDAAQLDDIVGEYRAPIGKPTGTPMASHNPRPSNVTEPFVLYGVR